MHRSGTIPVYNKILAVLVLDLLHYCILLQVAATFTKFTGTRTRTWNIEFAFFRFYSCISHFASQIPHKIGSYEVIRAFASANCILHLHFIPILFVHFINCLTNPAQNWFLPISHKCIGTFTLIISMTNESIISICRYEYLYLTFH
jgi:hypothetical protein